MTTGKHTMLVQLFHPRINFGDLKIWTTLCFFYSCKTRDIACRVRVRFLSTIFSLYCYRWAISIVKYSPETYEALTLLLRHHVRVGWWHSSALLRHVSDTSFYVSIIIISTIIFRVRVLDFWKYNSSCPSRAVVSCRHPCFLVRNHAPSTLPGRGTRLRWSCPQPSRAYGSMC